ncbi:MAG TPA: hypothetical protein PLS10_13655 [Chitinophagales bacterium]|nr:hypothetical protein [Chitinophagales bacterium]
MKSLKNAFFILVALLFLINYPAKAVVINNPDGTKVWFNTCEPGQSCPMTHSDSAMINLLEQLLLAYDMNLVDSAGTYYIASSATSVALNISPSSTVNFNIDTANLNLNFPDSFAIKKSNDSAFTWITTDSLTLNPLTYKSISYSVVNGTATVRIGSRTTTGIPEGYSANYISDGLLTERFRFVAVSGKIIVNATK